MKILVTGGTGFIGSHLVNHLIEKGNNVDVLVKEKKSFISYKKNKFNLIEGDITNRKFILNLIPNYQIVYHLAGLLGTSELMDKAYLASKVNILGTINILDGAFVSKTKVVYISKPNVWLNTYTITKETGENFVKMYFQYFKLPSVIIRWFNVYGPNQSFHCQKAVPYFIYWALTNQSIKIWGDGNQTMDLIYVTDTVIGTEIAALTKDLEGKIVEIGSGKEVAVNKLAKDIIRFTKSNSRIIHLGMRIGEKDGTHLKADISLIKKFGFKPKTSLADGLKKTINWYRDNFKNIKIK